MLPARRRRNRKLGFKSSKPKVINLKGIFFLVLGAFLVFFIVIILPDFLTNVDKLTIAINGENGNLIVSAFDFKGEEIDNLVIPSSTQFLVSRNLGTWKAGSLWQLGENEHQEGLLLKETLVKNFHFPITNWANTEALGFSYGNPARLFKSVFAPYKTNLTLGEKVKIAFLSLRVMDHKRNNYDLSKTSYLEKARFIDGEEGYVISSNMPQNITSIFAERGEDGAQPLKVIIKDGTAKYGLADDIGKTIEVMGAKIAAIAKLSSGDFDCMVLGRDKVFTQKVARVFSCQEIKGSVEGNFDLELRVGKNFAKRF